MLGYGRSKLIFVPFVFNINHQITCHCSISLCLYEYHQQLENPCMCNLFEVGYMSKSSTSIPTLASTCFSTKSNGVAFCKWHTKLVKEHPTIQQCHLALDSSTMCIYNSTMSSWNTKITKLYENKKVCMYTTSYETLHLHPFMYLDVSRMGGYMVCLSLQITHILKFIIIYMTQKEKQNIFHNLLRGLVSSRARIFS